MDGTYIQEWRNSNKASVMLEIQYSSILRALDKTIISAGGYLWSRKKVDIYVPRESKRDIPVIQLDDNGNEIKEWASASSAGLALSGFRVNQKSIILVCEGERKTALNFKWKFKNESDRWR